jgi:ATPase subunit of ABC transporter with duplicated ATPase domains
VEGLKAYPGTLILVSHDRWFVGQLATRIVEIQPGGIRDYPGTYEEYVHACGDDHLDVDTVVLKAKKDKRTRDRKPAPPRATSRTTRKQLEERQAGLITSIEAAEARIEAIDAMFCAANYFEETPPAEVRKAEAERSQLQQEIGRLMAAWEEIEEELDNASADAGP